MNLPKFRRPKWLGGKGDAGFKVYIDGSEVDPEEALKRLKQEKDPKATTAATNSAATQPDASKQAPPIEEQPLIKDWRAQVAPANALDDDALLAIIDPATPKKRAAKPAAAAAAPKLVFDPEKAPDEKQLISAYVKQLKTTAPDQAAAMRAFSYQPGTSRDDATYTLLTKDIFTRKNMQALDLTQTQEDGPPKEGQFKKEMTAEGKAKYTIHARSFEKAVIAWLADIETALKTNNVKVVKLTKDLAHDQYIVQSGKHFPDDMTRLKLEQGKDYEVAEPEEIAPLKQFTINATALHKALKISPPAKSAVAKSV